MNALLRKDRVFLAILFIGLFAMAARNVTDPDIWWHLKTGEYIAAHKSVPHADPFSFTRAGAPWVAHEWLTDFLLYQIQRTTGFAGLILIFAAILSAAFYLLYLRCGPAPYIAGIATLFAAWATRPIWGVRPQVLSFLLTSLWLLILERSDHNPKLLWWTVPLTVLWVNLHAGFALGIGLSVLFLVGALLERFLEYSAPNPAWRISASILFFDLLAVPLNPNGVRLFSYPLETLRSTTMQNYIVEWASPNFHRAEYWPFLFIVLATFATLSWSRVPIRPRDLLLLLVSLYAGLVSIRLMPFFILIAAPIISRRLGVWPKTVHQPHHQPPFRVFFNTAILLAISIFAAVHIASVIRRQTQAEAAQFPLQAVSFLQTHPPSGPIFNDYDWGGYLIWRLSPSTPVFIDGRADLYGAQLFHDFADAYQLKGLWQQILQRWHIETIIVPPDSALATGLRAAPGWIVAYQDPQAIIFTASPPTRSQSILPPLHPRLKEATAPPRAHSKVTLGMQFIASVGYSGGYYGLYFGQSSVRTRRNNRQDGASGGDRRLSVPMSW
ncbi:MAG: hypothetical protein WB523_23070 [Candidatus Sulfotelmatobacter sp.]